MKINNVEEACRRSWYAAFRGLRSQGWVRAGSAFCYWATPEGYHCAIGWLLRQPEEYKGTYWTGTVNTLFSPELKNLDLLAEPLRQWCAEASSNDLKEYSYFLYEMQQAHDASSDDMLESEFRRIGKLRGWTPPDE